MEVESILFWDGVRTVFAVFLAGRGYFVEGFGKSFLCDLENRTTWKLSRYNFGMEYGRSLPYFWLAELFCRTIWQIVPVRFGKSHYMEDESILFKDRVRTVVAAFSTGGGDFVERFGKSLLCDLENRTTWKMSRYYFGMEYGRSLPYFWLAGATL